MAPPGHPCSCAIPRTLFRKMPHTCRASLDCEPAKTPLASQSRRQAPARAQAPRLLTEEEQAPRLRPPIAHPGDDARRDAMLAGHAESRGYWQRRNKVAVWFDLTAFERKGKRTPTVWSDGKLRTRLSTSSKDLTPALRKIPDFDRIKRYPGCELLDEVRHHSTSG